MNGRSKLQCTSLKRVETYFFLIPSHEQSSSNYRFSSVITYRFNKIVYHFVFPRMRRVISAAILWAGTPEATRSPIPFSKITLIAKLSTRTNNANVCFSNLERAEPPFPLLPSGDLTTVTFDSCD